MVSLANARAPDGMRLFAIGDVHGCRDALVGVHRAIKADLAARPAGDWRIIHVGDYVDRGADSRGVLEILLARTADDPRVVCLRGNHDAMFADALRGKPDTVELWLINGGAETLESYGVALSQFLDAMRSGRPLPDAVPKPHRSFLDGLKPSAHLGDYYFVHAGIDPTRALNRQEPRAQLWIREPFLTSRQEFDAVVVHGHTPVRSVAVRPNRIGIDTGAVFGGPLSCLVLEGADRHLLCGDGLVPLPAP